MNTIKIYKWLAKFYDLLDVVYFREKGNNPRKAVIDKIPNDKCKIIDICTGTSTVLLKIADSRPDADIIGIDRSEEMLTVARNKIRIRGKEENVTLKCCDATDTGLKDEIFDIVLVSLVLHEIEEELAESILREARRVLKDNGKLIITEWEDSSSAIKKILFAPIKELEPKGFKEFLKKDISVWLGELGFVVRDIKHCDYTKVLECVKKK